MYSKENWQSMAEKEPPFGYDDNFQTSPSQKIQAFFKNTSARIAGRDACPTQEGGHSPQPGVSALPSPGASIALFHAHHAYPHCGQMWLKFIPLLPFALESALWAALALGIH